LSKCLKAFAKRIFWISRIHKKARKSNKFTNKKKRPCNSTTSTS